MLNSQFSNISTKRANNTKKKYIQNVLFLSLSLTISVNTSTKQKKLKQEVIALEEARLEQLPNVDYISGFSYLFQLLSHLTSSRELFEHKMHVIMQLSSHLTSGNFSKADIEAMFPQYHKRQLDSIINSLIDGGWLERQDGTLTYEFTNPGMLFSRFLPFLYKGDELDSMAFQLALKDMLEAAEHMNLGLTSLEFLRNQSIHAVMRNIEEIEAALVSKNEARIKETLHKTDKFLDNIGDFIKRFKDINQYKRKNKQELTEKDKESIQCLFDFEMKITMLFEYRKRALIQVASLGNGVFTKEDVDRFLYQTPFDQFALLLWNSHYTPSCSKWIDADGIVVALEEFLKLKRLRTSKKISPRVYGKYETPKNFEPSYIEKALNHIRELLDKSEAIMLEDFLFQFDNQTDVFMYLSSINFLSEKSYSPFELHSTVHTKEFDHEILRLLSEATLHRRK